MMQSKGTPIAYHLHILVDDVYILDGNYWELGFQFFRGFVTLKKPAFLPAIRGYKIFFMVALFHSCCSTSSNSFL